MLKQKLVSRIKSSTLFPWGIGLKNPDKDVIFRQVRDDVERISPQSGYAVDVASANFKNRFFFAALKYVGFDISIDELKRGLKTYPDELGILADVSVKNIGENYCDIAVSSNTIEHVPTKEGRERFLEHVIQAVRVDGDMILTIPKNYVTKKFLVLETHFKSVEFFYFHFLLTQNFSYKISDCYMMLMKRKDFFSMFLKGFVFIPYLFIYYFLRLTKSCSWGKSLVYLRCRGKKGPADARVIMPWVAAKQLEHGLYEL